MRVWWAERKGRGLPELQIEAARWAWMLAEVDQKHLPHYAGVLRKLGVEDPADGAAPWRATAGNLKIPDDPVSLVALLPTPKDGDFLARRALSERGRRAWSKLYDLELAAFPALAKGLEDPLVAPRCFRILKGVLHPYGLGDLEELETITTPAQAAAWWPLRKGMDLRELRLEAARYARAGIQKRTFPEPGDKVRHLRFIDEQIRSIEANPGAHRSETIPAVRSLGGKTYEGAGEEGPSGSKAACDHRTLHHITGRETDQRISRSAAWKRPSSTATSGLLWTRPR